MSSSATTRSAKAMHEWKNGYLLMSRTTLNARSVIVQCIRFTVLSASASRGQASIVRTIDERHASEQDFY
jgi:hypothetical protein